MAKDNHEISDLPAVSAADDERPIEERIEEVRRYCRSVGRQPSTVSLGALNNSKAFSRLLTRMKRMKADLDRYENFMKDNPPG